ncbi:unnamed protein product [Heligmosomoides polygyrus]|uniref:Neur_chan_LBD domain-containing protein n=1 Tax=Heligmosomoides polygyrus TaxID=6339 RepID=A0A183GE91_HELPZ|nr:unnamed protein product [Heligmosomoides polygyrus]
MLFAQKSEGSSLRITSITSFVSTMFLLWYNLIFARRPILMQNLWLSQIIIICSNTVLIQLPLPLSFDFQLDVYFQQFWKDPRLAHNESRRVLIRDKEVLSNMWHPDVYFANARIAEFHEVTQPNFLLWIEPDGSILYDTRISMVVVCTLNLEKWPLDSQRCHLRILSYAYTTDQLQIEWVEETPITRNEHIAMSDMHIVDLFPGSCDGNYSTGTWSCVTAEFFVKREVTHHVMQSYVPTTLIVVISWSVVSLYHSLPKGPFWNKYFCKESANFNIDQLPIANCQSRPIARYDIVTKYIFVRENVLFRSKKAS